jgi:hypothetical protein
MSGELSGLWNKKVREQGYHAKEIEQASAEKNQEDIGILALNGQDLAV